MTADRTLAAQLVAIACLRDMLTVEDKRIRAELEASLIPGDRVRAAVGDAQVVGAVTAKKQDPGGKVVAVVTDPAALTEWVAENVPTEVATIPARTEVRSAYLPVLLKQLAEDGGWPDSNGEVHPVPGVDLTLTGPSGGGLMVTREKDATDLIRAALASGEFDVRDILALPAGATP